MINGIIKTLKELVYDDEYTLRAMTAKIIKNEKLLEKSPKKIPFPTVHKAYLGR